MTRYRSMDELLENVSPDVADEIRKRQAAAAPVQKTEARQTLDAERKKNLTHRFETIWRRLGGPELEREFSFHPERKWRADYRIGNTLIEIEGGVWDGGRHTRGEGYHRDCEKYNAAAAAGYAVFRLPTSFVTDEYVQRVIDWVRERET